jgi:chitinase
LVTAAAAVLMMIGIGVPSGTSRADASPLPTVQFVRAQPSAVEPAGGLWSQVGFRIRLSAASTTPITVSFATADGTAAAPGDYLAKVTTVTIRPGHLFRVITVRVYGDGVVEPDETFTGTLTGATGATLGARTTVTAVIHDH